ncbi:protein kinase domain-containing protein [Sorangium sp. So ce1335]|uniref:serine/threonine-protein kinase n=1 Tax=Sorangium sp. So ce1335 TaxID=3133335 RepID=UPI003F605201
MRCSECHRRLPGHAGAACPEHPRAAPPARGAAEVVDPEPPPRIPGFRVEQMLGQGGFARVYAATREGDGRAVALKVARRHDDGRIAREAAALALLAPPWVPALLGRGHAADLRPFLALERLAGGSLASRLADLPGAGAAPLEEAAALARAVAAALDAVHDAGIVHRDLKPENVWLRPGGEVALIDFGLAAPARGAAGADGADGARAALGPDLTRTGAVLGTAAYMAPEQCLGAGALDPRADVYALGAMIFELLTGRPPFVGEAAEVRQAHVARRPAPPSAFARLPAAVDEVVLRCLAKDPGARPARAGDVARALTAALEARAASSGGGAVVSDARTAAPDARTAAPDARTAAPDARTADPEAHETSGSGARTAAPDARTAAPDARTAAPDARTAAPDARTAAAPDARTAAPDARTAAPDARTAAPDARTAAPDARTAAPGARTAEPGARTAEPAPRRPVALLALRSRERTGALVVDIARAEGGILARFRGEHTVLAFPAAAAPGDGVRAAVRAARHLVAAGLANPPLVVHVAPLRVREGAHGVTLAGTALETAEAWGAGRGGAGQDEPGREEPGQNELGPAAPAILTPEAQRALAEGPHGAPPPRDAPPAPRQAPPGAPGDAALRGRDAALAGALAAVQEALAGGGPALVTVLGAEGHGKTRFLGALAAALRAGGAAVHAAAAPGPEAAERGATLVALLRAALDLPASGALDATADTALARRLGPPEAARAWPAVGLALGRLAGQDPAAAPLLEAAGARRLAEARALAAALAAAAPLALLLDDADRADAAALDALELATAEGSPARLAVVLAARPSIASLRPRLGDRAARRLALDLGPLDDDAAGALLQDHLRPVEFIPRPVLDHLRALGRGVPRDLVEIACALRAGGAIRRAPGGEGWALAPDELLSLSAAPLGERLAARAVAALPPPLADLLERAAIVGDDLSPADLEAALDAPGAPPPAGALDPGVGLARLARAGVLVALPASPPRYAFRHPLLREAVEARTPPARRRALHAAVLRRLLDAPPAAGARARIARHAAAAGDARTAAAAHAELAEEALARHDVIEAEQRFTAALRLLDGGDDAARGLALAALAGRGRARYRLQRLDESLADLRAARALAEAAGDRGRAAELLLEEATALDWLEDFPASAEASARAAELCAGLGDARLDARCLFASGRSDCRGQRLDEGIPKVEQAARDALALGDHETHVIARNLLVGALSVAGRLDEAERHSDAVVEACRRAGDAFHLCGALINRVFMWMKRHEEDRALVEQREAVRLARELGHAQLERLATLNLAEMRFWMGAPDEALPLARRSLDLQRRFFNQRPSPDDALLLARIHLARGEDDAAARHLAEARASVSEPDLTPCALTLARLVQLALDDRAAGRFDAAAWRALVDEARRTEVMHERAEALHSAIVSALRAGAGGEARLFLAEARAASAGFWQQRLDEVERALAAPAATGAA